MRCHIIGRYPTSTSGLGIVSENSLSRVPRPPQNRTTFIPYLLRPGSLPCCGCSSELLKDTAILFFQRQPMTWHHTCEMPRDFSCMFLQISEPVLERLQIKSLDWQAVSGLPGILHQCIDFRVIRQRNYGLL